MRWGVWRIEDDEPGHAYQVSPLAGGAQAVGPGQRAVLVHEFDSPWRSCRCRHAEMQDEDMAAANAIAQPIIQADIDKVEGH